MENWPIWLPVMVYSDDRTMRTGVVLVVEVVVVVVEDAVVEDVVVEDVVVDDVAAAVVVEPVG